MPDTSPDLDEPTNAQANANRRRMLLALALLYVAPWTVYGILLRRQGADALDAWHGDTVWPAAHFLTHSQGGILMPIFGHVMIGLVGGLFVAMIAVGLCRLIAKLGLPDLGGPAGGAVLVLMPIWAFVFVKVVPERVTTVDEQARRLEVQPYHLWLRTPLERVTITGDQLRALDLGSRWVKRTGDRMLTMVALTRDGTLIELGERACDSSDEAACLREGDEDLVQLAAWLGHPGARVDTEARPGHHLLVIDE